MKPDHRPARRAAPAAPAASARLGVPGLAAALALAGLLGATGPAAAQDEPLSRASVEDFIELLTSGLPNRSFTRTELPDAATNRCARPAGAAGEGGAGGAAEPGGLTRRSLDTRTLEVVPVPYAGEAAPGVQLDIQFQTGSDRLSAADQALLDTLARALQDPRLRDARFTVAGHTDAAGRAALNLELSCARALSVQRHLATRGVAEARMTAYGFGSTRPLVRQAERARLNRRVEVRLEP